MSLSPLQDYRMQKNAVFFCATVGCHLNAMVGIALSCARYYPNSYSFGLREKVNQFVSLTVNLAKREIPVFSEMCYHREYPG